MTPVAAPESQHMQALTKANVVRLARADLKHAVNDGTTTAAEVVLACPWEAASMTIAELLLSQRRWGATRRSRTPTGCSVKRLGSASGSRPNPRMPRMSRRETTQRYRPPRPASVRRQSHNPRV